MIKITMVNKHKVATWKEFDFISDALDEVIATVNHLEGGCTMEISRSPEENATPFSDYFSMF